MYDVIPYFSAKMIADIPAFVIVPFIFNSITYFMIGFTDNID